MTDKPTSVPVIPSAKRPKKDAPVVIYDEDGPVVVVTKSRRMY